VATTQVVVVVVFVVTGSGVDGGVASVVLLVVVVAVVVVVVVVALVVVVVVGWRVVGVSVAGLGMVESGVWVVVKVGEGKVVGEERNSDCRCFDDGHFRALAEGCGDVRL
jgi:hypothetical protein